MWADTLSPVAFAPWPMARRLVADRNELTAMSRDEGVRRAKRFVAQANVSAPTALRLDFDSVPLPPVVEEGGVSSAPSTLAQRLQFLRVEAEIENMPFSESSQAALWSFLQEVEPTARPRLYLNENGNLRALWKNSDGEQIGLEFLGNHAIQYVIFRRRERIGTMARLVGIESDDRIFAHIRASNAQGLLFE